MIARRIDELVNLESRGKTTELDDIRAYSPDAVPSPEMRALWRLMLNGRITPSPQKGYLELHFWEEQLKCEGLSASLRMKLRELLAPMIVLREPIWWDEGKTETSPSTNMRRLDSVVKLF